MRCAMPAEQARNTAARRTDIAGMRFLTVAVAVVAGGIAAAAPVVAEPADPTTTEPTAAAPAESTSAAPTSTAPSESTSAGPAGARQVTYTVTTTSDLTANI